MCYTITHTCTHNAHLKLVDNRVNKVYSMLSQLINFSLDSSFLYELNKFVCVYLYLYNYNFIKCKSKKKFIKYIYNIFSIIDKSSIQIFITKEHTQKEKDRGRRKEERNRACTCFTYLIIFFLKFTFYESTQLLFISL